MTFKKVGILSVLAVGSMAAGSLLFNTAPASAESFGPTANDNGTSVVQPKVMVQAMAESLALARLAVSVLRQHQREQHITTGCCLTPMDRCTKAISFAK